MFTDDQLKNGVAQKLQALIGSEPLSGPLIDVRSMGQSLAEEGGILEPDPQRPRQSVEIERAFAAPGTDGRQPPLRCTSV